MIPSSLLWTSLSLVALGTVVTHGQVFQPCTSGMHVLGTQHNECYNTYEESISYDDIEKHYRGIFFTEDEILERSKVNANRRQDRLTDFIASHWKNDIIHGHSLASEHACSDMNRLHTERSKLRFKKNIQPLKEPKPNSDMGADHFEEMSAVADSQPLMMEALNSLPGDGDACCATEVHYFANKTMEDISGVNRTIIHLYNSQPPKFQLIPHGKCIGYGSCKGACFQEVNYLALLVYDQESKLYPPIGFYTFEVPGYCSCKNVT